MSPRSNFNINSIHSTPIFLPWKLPPSLRPLLFAFLIKQVHQRYAIVVSDFKACKHWKQPSSATLQYLILALESNDPIIYCFVILTTCYHSHGFLDLDEIRWNLHPVLANNEFSSEEEKSFRLHTTRKGLWNGVKDDAGISWLEQDYHLVCRTLLPTAGRWCAESNKRSGLSVNRG